ncbi:hypothetical protein KGQ71_04575, partial [Patescibacteria group bacterium]|nr:hypothetical protein [Patescibacteria group bacterium]
PTYHPAFDRLTPQILTDILNAGSFPAVSLYVPTVTLGKDKQQNRVRYQNALKKIETELHRRHRFSERIRELLKPAHQFLADTKQWYRPGEALAVFIAPKCFYSLWLPFPTVQRSVLADRFYFKPLLPYLQEAGRFYILSLSRKRASFYQANKLAIQEVTVPKMPRSMAEVTGGIRVEQSIQSHSVSAGGGTVAMFHGQYSLKEDEKEELRAYFRKIDKALRPWLARENAPLILAGVERYLPLYADVSAYRYIVPRVVPGNVDTVSAANLLSLAWAVVEPYFHQESRLARDRFLALRGVERRRTTVNPREAASRAEAGKVDTLILAEGDDDPGSDARLDAAALHTLYHSGRVYLLPPDEMPSPDRVAAILRY